MLSDEECREIWQTSLARCHPMNDISVAGILTAKAAFALGIERARKVKPPHWIKNSVSENVWHWQPHPNHRYEVHLASGEWVSRYNTNKFAKSDTCSAAKDACFAKHEAYVLSMLEQP